MNPILLDFIKSNLAFIVITAVALLGIVAAVVILAVTRKKAAAAEGFFVGGKRLGVKYALIGFVLVVLLFVNFVLYTFSGIITLALCGSGIVTDPKKSEEAAKNNAELCVEIATDGMTLLKNQNNALPLLPDQNGECKVNVFGYAGDDYGFVHQGAGSGGGTDEGIVTLYEGLRQSGVRINEDLATAYNNDWNYERQGWNDYKLPEADESWYTDARMQQAKQFSDTALIVFGRKGGETGDLPRYQLQMNNKKDKSRLYQQLTALEEVMIDKVTANFDKVIVVFNTTNVMEAGFVDNDKIDAAIAMYAPGTKGSPALGKLLKGEATFSGRTVDTWAYDLTTAAAWANAGKDGSHVVKAKGSDKVSISTYAEGIYEGYYWYETADKEGFWDSDFAKNKWGISGGYNEVVQFPFGYGLSYTDFSWEIEEISLPRQSLLKPTDKIEIKVFVKNIGEKYAGKDVVQLYLTAPYTSGGVEKTAVKLVAFAKTGLLQPGEGEVVTLEADVCDFASYDCYDVNNNGFMGYELEGGDYILSLRTNAHTVATLAEGSLQSAEITYKVQDEGYKLDKDPVTGNAVTNRFTNYTNAVSGATSAREEPSLNTQLTAYSVDGKDTPYGYIEMSRKNFAETFPVYDSSFGAMSEEFAESSYVACTPRINDSDVAPKTDSPDTNHKLLDFIYVVKDDNGNPILGEDGKEQYALVDYDDPRWDELVSQLSVYAMAMLTAKGGFGTIDLEEIGKPRAVDKDGPSGFNANVTMGGELKACTNFPCETLIGSTWDWKISYKFGHGIGEEANALGVDGIYGPGANIHRNVLNGRNFEYYSEDPVLSGIMTAYTVYGCKEKGVYCWIKHFVLNENEEGRTSMYQFCSEQALREIYLKPYETAVKRGGANAIMTSYGRVGTVRASASYALNTAVLRGEWGFKGAVITDYYNGSVTHDADECIRAGNDLMLDPNGNERYYGDLKSATTIKALHESSKHILYCYLETKYVSKVATGLDLSTVIGTKSQVFEWWKVVLYVFDGVIVGCGVTLGVLAFLHYRKNKKLSEIPTEIAG